MPEDHQIITCHATNIHGSSVVSQFINVDITPVVQFSRSGSVDLLLNTNLTVTCSAFSRPKASLEVFLPTGNKALSFQVSRIIIIYHRILFEDIIDLIICPLF